jgi:hypothetical protein
MSVVKIKIFVPEIANVMSLFDQIRVHRSEAGTPYSDAKFITDLAATAPVLSGTQEGPYASLQGKGMTLKVNGGAEQTVTFTSVNPISLANVIGEFNADITGATLSDDGTGKPKITGLTVGTAGVLELIGGSALAILGFTAGAKDNGEDENIQLLTGVDEYVYDDQSGEASYWYRTQYFNSVSGTFSSWSDWIKGDTGAAISSAKLIVGKIKMANIDGTALVGAKVSIVNVFNPLSVEGYFIAGSSREMETDGVGQAEATFIMGSTVDVVLVGTSVIRRILVPSTGTEFDIMDPILVQDDPFQIQVPDLPAAPRSS